MSSAIERVLRKIGASARASLDALSGADLTTLLLDQMRSRAAATSATDVLRQYGTDRFVAPAPLDFRALRETEDALLATLPTDFELVTLSPVAPLGTHASVALVDQNNVISTIRRTEVAADPTNALALEAAVRRRAQPADCVRLAAPQRVVRAQQPQGSARYAHFGLLGLVTAARDTGNRDFERQHVTEYLRYLVDALHSATGHPARIDLTPLDPAYEELIPDLDVEVRLDRNRRGGYYTGICYKVYVEDVELADGGCVDWTQSLLGNRKERALISGVGVDRVATISR